MSFIHGCYTQVSFILLFHRVPAHHLVSVFHMVSHNRRDNQSLSSDWQLDNISILPKRTHDTLSHPREAFQPVACPDNFPRSEESCSLMLVSCGLILAAPAQAKCHWWMLHSAGAPRGKGSALEHADNAEEWMLGIAFQPGWKSKHGPACPGGICDLVRGSSHPDPSHWRRLAWPLACRGGTLIPQREDHTKLWSVACTLMSLMCDAF